MRRLADGYTTFAEVYRYILTDGLIDGEISKLKATLNKPPEVIVVPLTNYELQDLANSALERLVLGWSRSHGAPVQRRPGRLPGRADDPL